MNNDFLFKIDTAIQHLQKFKNENGEKNKAGSVTDNFSKLEDAMIGLLQEIRMLTTEVRDLREFVNNKGTSPGDNLLN